LAAAFLDHGTIACAALAAGCCEGVRQQGAGDGIAICGHARRVVASLPKGNEEYTHEPSRNCAQA
jgi:hypothetical protein